MADNIRLNSFPSDRFEGLAMLYMQNQNLRGITPTELLEMYWNVYREIRNEFCENHNEKYRFRD